MAYVENTPTFEAVQWTGQNLAEVRQFITGLVGGARADEGDRQEHRPPNGRATEERQRRVTVHDGVENPDMLGWLCIWAYRDLDIDMPPQHWLVYGPIMRGAKARSRFFVVSAEQFAAQFTAAP